MIAFIKRMFAPIDAVGFYANLPLARTTSPDQIIAAAVVQSFAKHFTDWKVSSKAYSRFASNAPSSDDPFNEKSFYYPSDGREFASSYSHGGFYELQLTNSSKKMKLTFKFEETRSASSYHYFNVTRVYVDGVELDKKHSEFIILNWKKIQKEVAATEAAAATAKKNMEKNDAAWNVVERLLGLKRNEQGALVPIEKVE